jgi:hypothetical protein
MTESIPLSGKLPVPVGSTLPDVQTSEPDTYEDTSEYISRPVDDFKYEVSPQLYQENSLSEAGGDADTSAQKRREIIRKIIRYRTIFKAEVVDLDLENLGEKSLSELQNLLLDTEFLVSTRRAQGATRSMFLATTTILESVGPHAGFKLNGLTNVCSMNEDLLTTVDEVSVKYEKQLMIDPIARLGLIMAQLRLAVHRHNSRNEVSPLGVVPTTNDEFDKPAEESDNFTQAVSPNEEKRQSLLDKLNQET